MHLYTLVRCVKNTSTVTAGIAGIAVLQCRFLWEGEMSEYAPHSRTAFYFTVVEWLEHVRKGKEAVVTETGHF